jgi:hypothetical protein
MKKRAAQELSSQAFSSGRQFKILSPQPAIAAADGARPSTMLLRADWAP